MKQIKAFGIAVILVIIFIWIILIMTTKVVIPFKLDIGDSIETPNVVELELSDAKQKLIEAGFVFQDSVAIEWVVSPIYPDKTVISQMPIAGKVVKNRNRIKLEVSTGGKQVVIPLILEDNAINASSRLKQLGLEVLFIRKNYGLFTQNTVVKVQPEVGTKVLKGSKVVLYIESESEDDDLHIEAVNALTEKPKINENSTEENISIDTLNIDDSTLEEILRNN